MTHNSGDDPDEAADSSLKATFAADALVLRHSAEHGD